MLNEAKIKKTAVFCFLFRYYASIFLGIRYFKRLQSGKKPPTPCKMRRIVLTHVVLIIIGSVIVVHFILVFGNMFLNRYAVLKSAGIPMHLFTDVSRVVFFILFGMYFLLTLTSYSMGEYEMLLKTLPIAPALFFSAKFCAVLLPAIGFSFISFLPAAVVYGYGENPPFLFYPVAFAGAALFPLPIVCICYAVHIPVMRFTALLKERKRMRILSGVCGFFIVFGVNYLLVKTAGANTVYQSGVSAVSPVETAETTPLFSERYSIGYFFILSLRAVADYAFSKGIAYFLLYAAGNLLFVILLIRAGSSAYYFSLEGFDESSTQVFSTAVRKRRLDTYSTRRTVFISLLKREIMSVIREPAYVLYGLSSMSMPPLLFAVLYMNGSFPLPAEIEALVEAGFGALLAGIVGGILGGGHTVAVTAVSRDIRNMLFIRSLPVDFMLVMQVKFLHALLYGCIGAVMGAAVFFLLLDLPYRMLFPSILIACALSYLFNFLGIVLDTILPHHRDSSVTLLAFNSNVLILFFAEMTLSTVLIIVAVYTGMPVKMYALCFTLLPVCAVLIAEPFFRRYAERKLAQLADMVR